MNAHMNVQRTTFIAPVSSVDQNFNLTFCGASEAKHHLGITFASTTCIPRNTSYTLLSIFGWRQQTVLSSDNSCSWDCLSRIALSHIKENDFFYYS